MTVNVRHRWGVGALLSFGILCMGAPLSAQNAICINVEPAAVQAALDGSGFAPLKGNPQGGTFEGDLVILQARGVITDEIAEGLGRFVQQGGSLLVGFDEGAGIGIQRLGFMLPTMAWHSRYAQERRGEARLIEPDPAFFPNPDAVKDFSVRFHYEIRPWHAVERGQARYDRYLRPLPYKDFGTANPTANDVANLLPKGSFWWTRPLINRDWTVRARCNDYAQTPLLITGRYGAGKVAVFASNFENVDREIPFWNAVVTWLRKDEHAPGMAGDAAVAMEFVYEPGVPLKKRELEVKLTNHGGTSVDGVLLGRLLTWEEAIVGDVQKQVTIPAGATVSVTMPLPEKASATSYQALATRDEYKARVGLLSANGERLLAEKVWVADLRPAVSVQVVTTEERGRKRPFHAPAIGKEARSGLPIHSYAYQQGATVEGSVVISNGVRNIAALAKVTDEAYPENPSLAALTDESSRAESRPDWYALDAWGFYEGKGGREQVLLFEFPKEATVTAVTLYGAADRYRNHMRHNPKRVVIEADGVEVAREERAEWRIPQGNGVLRLEFPATKAKTVKVRLGELGVPPRLAEIGIEGAIETEAPEVKDRLLLQWRNALTNEVRTLTDRVEEVPSLGRVVRPFKVVLPEGSDATPYRLEASFGGTISTIPVLAVNGARSFRPIEEVASPTDVSMGFIVTRGFRNIFNIGVGTQEILEGWGQPDDLVWAYSRGLKQNAANTRMRADRLYVSDNDMRHYSTPWRSFYNGERFWDVALPLLVERAKEDRGWKDAGRVHLGFSDRWDTGPTVNLAYSWMDLEAFHRHLRSKGGAGLTGKTRDELVREVNSNYSGQFNAWQLQEYERDLRNFRTQFAAEGKKVVIQAQGAPLVPLKEAEVISDIVRGMNDDNTWGMAESSIPLTTGRQMGVLAFNPFLAMTALGSWGWDESVLNNIQWRGPVGTTEPSRRHIYNRAFRGVIRPDGSYRPMNTYGYNFNGGAAFTLNENDFNEWQRVEERQSLLTPEAPLGAGLIFSTAYLEKMESLRISGGGPGGNSADEETMMVASFVRRLHENGISLPFSGNAGMLSQWRRDAPLVLANAERFSAAELTALRVYAARGGRIVAFAHVAKGLPVEVANVFGVNAAGKPVAGRKVGTFAGQDVTLNGTMLFVPLQRLPLTEREGEELAPILKAHLDLPLRFPSGTAGYGFRSNGRSFIVVEDWREEGRTVTVTLKAKAGVKELRAASVNEHAPLKVSREGGEWAIEIPLRPGDAELICLEEVK